MIGCIAQEVGKVFPVLFSEKRGYKSLSYSDFGVLAIGSIKELNDKFEKALEKLTKKVDALAKKVK